MSARFSRRTWLRGAGTAIALPFFESLVPRGAHAADPPRRLIAYYVPNGIHMADWTPTTEGAGYEAPTILRGLGALAPEVSVLTGLCNRPARPDGPGDHASGTAAFLTAVHPKKTAGSDIRNGISMDQVAANKIGIATPFPSLQLGIAAGNVAGNCDSGYSCAYTSNISWAGPATPLAKVTDPSTVFDRLFAGFDPDVSQQERDKRRRYRTSVLDFAKQQATKLKARLGSNDREKLDEYLTGVREVETRIDNVARATLCEPPTRFSPAMDFPAKVKLMSDLMVLALRCDLTRIITFMLGNAASGRSFPFLGIPNGHHEISHHKKDPANLQKLTAIGTWEIEQLAYLLAGLKNIREGSGTLLDNTAVFFSSEIEDGDSHSHLNMPVLVAGRAGGALNPGRHVVYPDAPSVANLYVSLLAAIGTPVASFGDSTGALANL